MSKATVAFLLSLLVCSSITYGSELIGGRIVRAPDSATLPNGPFRGGNTGWLNVVNTAIDIQTSFTGESIIDDGVANLEQGDTIEVTFDQAVINRSGADLVLYDARYDDGSYGIRTDYDNFTLSLTLDGITDFTGTGEVRGYYFERSPGSVFPAQAFEALIDLSDLGVPAGASVNTLRFTALNIEADPLGLGAIVPEPGSLFLLGGVLALTRAWRTRRP